MSKELKLLYSFYFIMEFNISFFLFLARLLIVTTPYLVLKVYPDN